MKKHVRSLFSVGTLAVVLGAGIAANAQDKQPSTDPQTSPTQTAPTTQRPSDNNSNAQSTPVGTAQTFTGTVMKSGDKFVLQDASGTSYDVDKQEALKSFEGKKVNIKGTLDQNGKLIHVQE